MFTERVRLSWFSLNWVHLLQNDGKVVTCGFICCTRLFYVSNIY